MQASQKSSASTKSSLFEDETNSDKFITIPCPDNLQGSLPLMTNEQISFNLIELNLVSIYNPQILHQIYEWSTQTKFYLENRYILQNVINTSIKLSPTKFKASKNKKQVLQIVQKYDSIYVNGKSKGQMKKQRHIIKQGMFKEIRAKFISEREEFVSYLQSLSETLKSKENQYQPDQLREYYQLQLTKLNQLELHNTLSPSKLELLRNPSVQSFSSNQDGVTEISSTDSSPKKKQNDSTLFSMVFQGQIYLIKHINKQKSGYIRTKNRYPLVLDFQFSRFIYKNDNQLSHQLIAMHLMKYINKVISLKMKNPQVIEYQIIPEAHGAFYQFVQNSKTVGNIKKLYPQSSSISEYLNDLQKKSHHEDEGKQMSSVRKRFAETFAGFSTVQYLLDLKDRNNQNIMIREDGSIFHIDLAFIFSATPGGVDFEKAPYKFTKDYLQAMGGFQSDTFKYYQSLMVSNFTRLFINKEQLFTKIGILSARRDQILCFKNFNKDYYMRKLPKQLSKVHDKVQQIIHQSYDNWRTRKYDFYQKKTNNIQP